MTATTNRTSSGSVGRLDCQNWGGPNDANFMVYWRDPQTESPNPFLQQQQREQDDSTTRQYVLLEPDVGAWNNIRMGFETAVALTLAMNRVLVLPPAQQHYKMEDPSSYREFFPLENIPAIQIISMKEFLESEVLTNNIVDLTTRQPAMPPKNRTDWDGATREESAELYKWLRTIMVLPPWNPDVCLVAFGNETSLQSIAEATPNMNDYKRFVMYKNKPPAPNAAAAQRLPHLLGRRRPNFCFYEERYRKEKALLFAGDMVPERLLVHFYAFVFFEDWRQDLWIKRFVRDNLRYGDQIQCVAARILTELKKETSLSSSSDGKSSVLFDTFHVRRGDFLKNTWLSAEEIYNNVAGELVPNSTIYVATDEMNRTFFEHFQQKGHRLRFLSDFDLGNLHPKFYPMVDQLVAAHGRTFIGCFFSTFTAFILRLRGYLTDRGSLIDEEWRISTPNNWKLGGTESFFYVPKQHKRLMKIYSPLKHPLYAREFPIAWRDIDFDTS